MVGSMDATKTPAVGSLWKLCEQLWTVHHIAYEEAGRPVVNLRRVDEHRAGGWAGPLGLFWTLATPVEAEL